MTIPPGIRGYRALLRALPPLFRASYGCEMEELFMEALRAHRQRWRLAWLAAWVRGAVDVLLLALRFRLRPPSGGRHEATGGGGLQSVIQDLRFSLRSLRRRPLFATVGILTLGLAIGASTAMFSVVDGVLLKALPYRDPGRLVAVWQTIPDRFGRGGIEGRLWDRARLTYSQYGDLSEENRIYERLAAYRAGHHGYRHVDRDRGRHGAPSRCGLRCWSTPADTPRPGKPRRPRDRLKPPFPGPVVLSK